jgi:hypothetical protein
MNLLLYLRDLRLQSLCPSNSPTASYRTRSGHSIL